MPYIKAKDREKYNSLIEDIIDELTDHGFKPFEVGDLNYIISKICWELFDKNRRYKTGNDILGVLSGVEKEFYRRKLGIYEDEKVKSEGDI